MASDAHRSGRSYTEVDHPNGITALSVLTILIDSPKSTPIGIALATEEFDTLIGGNSWSIRGSYRTRHNPTPRGRIQTWERSITSGPRVPFAYSTHLRSTPWFAIAAGAACPHPAAMRSLMI